MQHQGTKNLETQHLILRKFCMGDAEKMFENWASDPVVSRFMRWNTHTSIIETKQILAEWTAAQEKRDHYNWAICLKSGEPIGSIGLLNIHETDCSAEIGYCIGQAFWKNGYTTEALVAVLQYSFTHVEFNRIEAYHSVNNPISGMVMKKVGMICEGMAKEKCHCREGFQDCYLYGITKSAWEARTILETERLTLRQMSSKDYEALCKILQDPLVMYAYEHAFSSEEVQTWLDKQLQRYLEFGFGLWAVVLKETGEVIGQCGLTMQEWGTRQVLEIGYLFQRAYWHKGYAIEAAKACKGYALYRLGAEEIYSIIRDNNLASRKVAERNGMQVLGEFTKHYYGIDMPHLVYGTTKAREEKHGNAINFI